MKDLTKKIVLTMFVTIITATLQATEPWQTQLAKNQFKEMNMTEAVDVPVLDGEWWQVSGPPKTGHYDRETGDWYKSAVFIRPLDFAMWKARDGSWQIVSCVKRFMKNVPNNRVFYRWEGKSPTDKNFKEMGIFMVENHEVGDFYPIQAPYVMMKDDKYYMFYNTKSVIRCMISDDGKVFEKIKNPDGSIWEVPKCARDVTVIYDNSKWYMYYCGDMRGSLCRYSSDFYNWSDEFVVAPGTGESPFVLKRNGYFYYTHNFMLRGISRPVYMSKDPTKFGDILSHTNVVGLFEDDFVKTKKIAGVGPKAYEIIEDNGQYYAAAYNGNSRDVKNDSIEKQDRNGIWLAKIKWVKKTPEEILKWKIEKADRTCGRTPLETKQRVLKDHPMYWKGRFKIRLREKKITKEEYDKQMSELESPEEWKARWDKLLKEETEMLNKEATEGK